MYDLPITTVTVPAANYDLTDLTTTKNEFPITNSTADDDFLTRAIHQASAAIRNYCNRVFQVETLQDLFYQRRSGGTGYWRGWDDHRLQLSRRPVTTITSVIETDFTGITTTLVADTDYKLDAARGILERLDSTISTPLTAALLPRAWAASIVTVIYAAGYAVIPDDVIDATLRLITARYKARGRDPMQRSMGEPGLGQVQWWIGTLPGQDGALPPEIANLVDAYRTPTIG